MIDIFQGWTEEELLDFSLRFRLQGDEIIQAILDFDFDWTNHNLAGEAAIRWVELLETRNGRQDYADLHRRASDYGMFSRDPQGPTCLICGLDQPDLAHREVCLQGIKTTLDKVIQEVRKGLLIKK